MQLAPPPLTFPLSAARRTRFPRSTNAAEPALASPACLLACLHLEHGLSHSPRAGFLSKPFPTTFVFFPFWPSDQTPCLRAASLPSSLWGPPGRIHLYATPPAEKMYLQKCVSCGRPRRKINADDTNNSRRHESHHTRNETTACTCRRCKLEKMQIAEDASCRRCKLQTTQKEHNFIATETDWTANQLRFNVAWNPAGT